MVGGIDRIQLSIGVEVAGVKEHGPIDGRGDEL
jgi:hypothetical protein